MRQQNQLSQVSGHAILYTEDFVWVNRMLKLCLVYYVLVHCACSFVTFYMHFLFSRGVCKMICHKGCDQ
jgi:hypothetical protein